MNFMQRIEEFTLIKAARLSNLPKLLLVPIMFIWALMGSTQAASPDELGASAREEYRWTGSGGDKLWSTVSNWELHSEHDNWTAAKTPPSKGSRVVFGDIVSAEGKQIIFLTYHVNIGGIIIAASRPDGDYTLQSKADDSGGIDSDSGVRYTIRLSDRISIMQTEAASSTLTFHAEVILTFPATPVIQLKSTHRGRIEVLRGISPDTVIIEQGKDGANGVFEVAKRNLINAF